MNSATTDAASLLLNASTLHNDAHFLRAVTDMADSQEVVADSAIYSESGIKLLDKGGRIDSRLYELLIQHRLVTSIDEQLSTRDVVDRNCLEAQVLLLSGSTQLGQLLAQHMGERHHLLLEALRHLKWPQSVSFKMTVMRHQMPELFEHSVLMMMVAVFLGRQQGMEPPECADLAAAALLHDVGMLYMPPNWLNPQHKLTPQEHRQLAAHSITAMLVVQGAKVYPRAVADAVLEHHERLDGSGYPRNTKGDEVGAWGRILMLAEVVSAFYSKFSDMPAQRLSLMLRMNHNRFDAELVQHVFALLAQAVPAAADTAVTHTSVEVREVIATLGAVFQHWTACKRKFPSQWQALPGGRAGVYVDLRMQALEKSLAESGSHPRQQADWLRMFEEDPSSMGELVLINKEALWQVNHCIEACVRRWPQLLQPRTTFDAVMHDWLHSCCTVLGHADRPAAVTADAAI